ncbi:MAG: thioredoxin [Betaproteobacteria bacterium HGW-Betaproteobacteria-16]|nr:MAG: thioredoxin [Betaproteobacteria bacterium HGW-Betaproteobacteria-16]
MRFRHFLSAFFLVLASFAAHAIEIKPFTLEALTQAQTSNQPVALLFHADWCPTCRAQDKVLQSFKNEAGLELTVLIANYDTEKELKKRFNVRAQSTFVVLRGQKESARLIGDTDPAVIRAALKSAL